MKKVFTVLAGLLTISLCASAAVVGTAKAEKIAQRWLGTASATLVWDGSTLESATDGQPVLYVYNNPEGGWIMISAEDATCPVLAYSDSGSFKYENMPSNLSAWIDGYAKSIQELRRFKVAASAEAQQLWQTAGYRTKASSGKLLETVNWDQDTPYNNLCPQVTENGKTYNALTGCVATAMAIVLRYHNWPEHGKGTIGGYSYTSDYSKKITIDEYSIDSHEYDYTLMPKKCTSSSTSAQKNAVAQLIHDCGVMVEAQYNYESGTGALSENIANALFQHMYYSGQAYLAYRSEYNNAEWIKMIEAEIDAERPVLYGASDSDAGGHQFVCDGYDGKDYLHINWGWSGSDNAYYSLDLKIPGSYAFSDDQDAVIGLSPDKDSSTTAANGPLSFYYYQYGYSSYKGLTISSGSVASKSFTAKAGCILNDNYRGAYNGKIRAALMDKDENLKGVVSSERTVSLDEGEITIADNLKCNITSNMVLGDHVVLQYSKSDGTWAKVRAQNDSGNMTDILPYVDCAYIKLADSYNSGDKLFFELVPGAKAVKSISWTYDGATTKNVTTTVTTGLHTIVATVTMSDGTVETITTQIQVN